MIAPMFMLAHLSDLHLAARPRLARAFGKRGLGFINWHRKRKHIHRREVLDAITRDLKASRDRPHRGDRRSRQFLAADGISARARLARNDRRRRATSPSFPAITTSMCRGVEQCPAEYWGDYMRGDDGVAALSVPAAARRRGADRAVDRRCRPDRSWRPAGSARGNSPASPRCSSKRAGSVRVVLIHHPPLSPPRRFLRRLDRRRRVTPGAGGQRRRTAAARPRSSCARSSGSTDRAAKFPRSACPRHRR